MNQKVMTIKSEVIKIDDNEKIRTLLGRTKRDILRLLSEEYLSVLELAERLDKDRSNIYRHIQQLEEMGFVTVKKEKKRNYKTKKLYGKTADLFIPFPENLDASSSTNMAMRWDEESTSKVLKILSDLNLSFEEDEQLKEDIIEFFDEMDKDFKDMLNQKDGFDDLDFFSVMRLKLLRLFIEIQQDSGVQERLDDILERFEK